MPLSCPCVYSLNYFTYQFKKFSITCQKNHAHIRHSTFVTFQFPATNNRKTVRFFRGSVQKNVVAWTKSCSLCTLQNGSCGVPVWTDRKIQTVLISTLNGGDLSTRRPGHINPPARDSSTLWSEVVWTSRPIWTLQQNRILFVPVRNRTMIPLSTNP